MKTRRTQVFKEPSKRGLLIETANVPYRHAEFWAMVAQEMSQPDAMFLKIV